MEKNLTEELMDWQSHNIYTKKEKPDQKNKLFISQSWFQDMRRNSKKKTVPTTKKAYS